MDDRKSEALLTTVKTGSFSKAAEELSCTQSAVTQMMNTLEDELGVKILQRSHNGVRLTEQGEQLYPNILECYRSMLRLKHNATVLFKGKDKPLRIGAFSSISNSLLSSAILDYLNENPETSINLTIATGTLEKMLLDGELDLIICDVDIITASRWTELMLDQYYAVFPSNTAPENKEYVTIEELLKYPILIPTLNDVNPYLKKANHLIDIQCDDDITVLNFVAKGLGATAIPKLSLWSVPENVTVIPIKPKITRTIGYSLPNSPREEALKFAAYIEQRVAQGI